MATISERVAVLEDRSEGDAIWRQLSDSKLNKVGEAVQEVYLWKMERMKRDEIMEQKIDVQGRKLDALTLKFMIVWGFIIAGADIVIKQIVLALSQGHLHF